MVRPIAPHELGVKLARSFKVWPKPPEDWHDIAEFYVEALEDVPSDLVDAALKHVRLNCKWFPRPAEIRGAIIVELERRRQVFRRVQTMAQRLEREPPEPMIPPAQRCTPEQLAQVDDCLKHCATALRNKPEPVRPKKLAEVRTIPKAVYTREQLAVARATLTGRNFVERPAPQHTSTEDPDDASE